MNLLDDIPEGTLVGLDASIWIYEFEGNPTYGPIVHPFFRDRLDAGKNRFGSFLLTLAEVLVLPIALGQKALADRYRAAFLPRTGFEAWEITRDVIERAAELRAKYRLKMVDSLHVAAAILNRVDLFLSNDDDMLRVTEIKVLVLDRYLPGVVP